MGAWIETGPFHQTFGTPEVAPYVGAWIETHLYHSGIVCSRSHPMWVRGLKPKARITVAEEQSRTLCGCVD